MLVLVLLGVTAVLFGVDLDFLKADLGFLLDTF